MEFFIAFTATFIIGTIITIGIRQTQKNNFNHPPATNNPKPKTKNHSKLQQTDEELITVILPTISDNK